MRSEGVISFSDSESSFSEEELNGDVGNLLFPNLGQTYCCVLGFSGFVVFLNLSVSLC